MTRIGLPGALLAAAALVAGAWQAGTGTEAQSLRVLFIGNSVMGSNDLPATVSELATLSGRKLQYRSVIWNGSTLEDHWNFGAARPSLASGDWDVVVMQQGPSVAPWGSQEHLSTWASRFADLAREAGTRPALFTAWPPHEQRSAMPDVVASYRMAAQAAGAELFPVGEAWQAAWRCRLHPSLYGPDGAHASPVGTYEAALVVYGALYDAPVRSRRLYRVGDKPRTSRLLQAAAATALGRWLPPSDRCG